MAEFLRCGAGSAAESAAGPFDFLASSRLRREVPADLSDHIANFLEKFDSAASVRRVAVPLIASSLILDHYSPGMHLFDPHHVFRELYQDACSRASSKFRPGCRGSLPPTEMVRLISSDMFTQFAQFQAFDTPLDWHRRQLYRNRSILADVYSSETCFSCIRRRPKHHLHCGHFVCGTCIENFYTRDESDPWLFRSDACHICGQPTPGLSIRITPHTGRTRVLSIDGGGIRGAAPIGFLKAMQDEIGIPGYDVQRHFDVKVGTSSGALSVISLDILGWSVDDCMDHLRKFADASFSNQPGHLLRLLSRVPVVSGVAQLLSFLHVSLTGSKYSADGLEELLADTYGSERRITDASEATEMGTHVGVTLTRVSDGSIFLATNYNAAGTRSQDADYYHLSADDGREQPTWCQIYFPPEEIDGHGSFQDGGITCNNPAYIAVREAVALSQDGTEPSIVVSLGTGSTATSGAESPGILSDWFPLRLWRALWRPTGSKNAWEHFRSHYKTDHRTNFFRFDLELVDDAVALDDVDMMDAVQRQACDTARGSSDLRALGLLLRAEFFLFELDPSLPPRYSRGAYECVGRVTCRLRAKTSAYVAFMEQLCRGRASIQIGGQVLEFTNEDAHRDVCLRVCFSVPSLSSPVAVRLVEQGHASNVSGSPFTVEWLVRRQELDMRFGTTIHRRDRAMGACTSSRISRCMRIGANFPEVLWPEITACATYVYNRTPSASGGWKAPYELFHSRFRLGECSPLARPDLSHLRSYGCRADAMTSDAQLGRQRKRKLVPRAWLGILVGYTSSNSYRIWNPLRNEVFTTRDVVFDEHRHFDGSLAKLAEEIREMDLEEIQQRIDQLIRASENTRVTQDAVEKGDDIEEHADASANAQRASSDTSYTKARFEPLLTPPQFPPAVFFTAVGVGGGDEDEPSPLGEESPKERTTNRISWKAAFLAGIRPRKRLEDNPRRAHWPDHPVAASQGGHLGKFNRSTLAHKGDMPPLQQRRHAGEKKSREETRLRQRALSASAQEGAERAARGASETSPRAAKRKKASLIGTHWKNLSPLPSYGQLAKHPYRDEFREAEKSHLQGHKVASSWEKVSRAHAAGHQILGCHWVYTYKLDKHGRNVIQDTHSGCSTLRPRATPIRLRKALYGLRRSPLLWQRHLEIGLQAIGFRRAASENCCWQKGSITFFFYVDDCVLAFRRELRESAMTAIRALQQRYHLEGGQDLQLGIEAARGIERSSREPSEGPLTPMTREELLPYEGTASTHEIHDYQVKIGKILYAAVMTRPDIAFEASRLARFNQNPGPLHHTAANRALRYLDSSKHLCLEFGANPGGADDTLEVASDASFTDNSLDRRSSQAFAMKLFGGMIAWRVNKQTTVTASTTEAELLALSSAAKEAIFASRLISSLQIDLPDEKTHIASYASARRSTPTIRIQCDSTQTVRLVTTELVRLQTKLRHVDVHNHWLRQEVAEGKVSIEYTPSAEMMADGLMKSLAKEPFRIFRKQLNIKELIEGIIGLDAEIAPFPWRGFAEEHRDNTTNTIILYHITSDINSCRARFVIVTAPSLFVYRD
ncbi:retrotransposon hobase [Fusarium albosuccineum]|uniref:Retrotransposon hobase n=1 Tax=Fusarium albosuccineum TaxID=1237068 RepID=A0A8H4PHK4_9HYPO|nr:retrotransposon hobase [Fusarium albosuccineum]